MSDDLRRPEERLRDSFVGIRGHLEFFGFVVSMMGLFGGVRVPNGPFGRVRCPWVFW